MCYNVCGGRMAKFKKGSLAEVTVTAIESYGIFVSCEDYYTGLIHISEISNGFVKDINDYVKIGDVIYAQILDIDDYDGHLKLSIKNINYKQQRKKRRKKLIETKRGFKTLEYFLPIWIEEALKKHKINKK